MSQEIHPVEKILLRSSGIFILVILWELLPVLNIINPKYLPRFTTAVKTLALMFLEKNLLMHLSVSLWRVLSGLVIAGVLGLFLGIVLTGFYINAVEVLNPLLRVLSQVNPFSLLPVFILFFGIGEEAKLAIIVWVCIWPVLFNTITGLRNIEPGIVKTARSMNISLMEMTCKVLLPAASPSIFLGLRLGAQMSFFMLIAGEMLGANAGLGLTLHKAGHLFDAPALYAVSLCIVLLGVSMNRFLLFLERGIFFWREEVIVHTRPVSATKVTRLGKPELALVALIFMGILFLGFQQVDKANNLGKNPIKHEHHSK